jgi:hypothetical protein
VLKSWYAIALNWYNGWRHGVRIVEHNGSDFERPLSKRQQGVYRWELEVCISWPDFHGAAMTIMYGGPEWVLYRGKSRKSLNKVIKTVRDHPRLMLITIKDPKGQIERVPPQRIAGRS